MASKRRKGSQLLTARVVEILTVGRTRLYSRSTAAKAAVMDRARQAVEDIVANPPESKGFQGVTTFIRQVLRNNTSFSPRVDRSIFAGNRTTSERGLQIGRFCDTLFQRIVQRKAKLSATSHQHRRIAYVFEILKQKNIVPFAVQVPVSDSFLRIRTRLDGVGWDTVKKEVVVLELKTTQHTLAQHLQRYTVPCAQCPVLSNGLPNTEKNQHAIQAAFGVLALQRVLKDFTVTGAVIVAASDGAKIYTSPQSLAAVETYDVKRCESCGALASLSCEAGGAKFLSWPIETQMFDEHLRKIGYYRVKAEASGKVSAIGKRRDGTPVLFGLVHHYSGYNRSKTHQRHCRALKAAAKKRKKCGAVLVWVDKSSKQITTKRVV